MENKFKRFTVNGDITYKYLIGKEDPSEEHPEGKPVYKYEQKNEDRVVTLCQLEKVIDTSVRLFNYSIGLAIMNPEDENSNLGETIARGRAEKNPIRSVELISVKRLPKPILEEQFIWAKKIIERNLDNYVNNTRESIKKL